MTQKPPILYLLMFFKFYNLSNNSYSQNSDCKQDSWIQSYNFFTQFAALKSIDQNSLNPLDRVLNFSLCKCAIFSDTNSSLFINQKFNQSLYKSTCICLLQILVDFYLDFNQNLIALTRTLPLAYTLQYFIGTCCVTCSIQFCHFQNLKINKFPFFDYGK